MSKDQSDDLNLRGTVAWSEPHEIESSLHDSFNSGSDNGSSSNNVTEANAQLPPDEYDYDYCEYCECDLAVCGCSYCEDCGAKPPYCVCDGCEHCGRRGRWCVCSRCPECRGRGPCDCPRCASCNEPPRSCTCFEYGLKEIDLREDPLFIYASTTDLEQGVWNMRDGLMLRGYVENYHIIIIRKPQVIARQAYHSVYNIFKNTYDGLVRDISKYYHQKILWYLKGTRMYAEGRKIWSQVAFKLEPEVESTHVNVTTKAAVDRMVTQLSKIVNNGQPVLSFDCEGVDLGRNGTTCYIQIHDLESGTIYLVNLLTLGQKAWSICGKDKQTTLKHIFENKDLTKIIFDCRSDSDALYAEFGIKLAGVLDVQYLHMMTRPFYSQRRPNYNNTVLSYASKIGDECMRTFLKDKSYPFGGDYTVFKIRPLPPRLKMYAVNDVKILHKVAAAAMAALSPRGVELAFEWTDREVKATWQVFYFRDSEPWNTSWEFANCWQEEIHVPLRHE